MASVKDYETLTKKIAATKAADRGPLVQEKAIMLAALREEAGDDRAKKRALKFELDEANNS
ncbi:MAG: hypothetical protein AAGC72_15045 [Planctomycetota bacterium]